MSVLKKIMLNISGDKKVNVCSIFHVAFEVLFEFLRVVEPFVTLILVFLIGRMRKPDEVPWLERSRGDCR